MFSLLLTLSFLIVSEYNETVYKFDTHHTIIIKLINYRNKDQNMYLFPMEINQEVRKKGVIIPLNKRH